MTPSPLLKAEHLKLTFPNGNGGLEVLDEITFAVAREEFVAVLGPSGCGKSTLLRVLAGLLRPTEGRVCFDGQPLEGPQTRVGLVFQQANLMPWRTVLRNITLPLELRKVPWAEARRRAEELIALVGLQGFEDTLPRDLSGGMAQRVAIARALIHDPEVLLLDEPFASLDALTRERMWEELLRIWQARRKTVIMVTHSVTEALLLADRVLVLSPRPARLRLDVRVDLPRPRSMNLRYTPEFARLDRRLRSAIGWE